MEPYKTEDDDRDWLTISEYDGKPGMALVRTYRGGVVITQDKIPAIVTALAEACGLQALVILKGPSIADGEEWRPEPASLLRVARDRDRLTVRTTMDGGAAVLTPAAARAMAGILAALADEAEAEPDPEEVEELAAVMHRDREQCGGAGELDRQSAAAALRWMNAKGKHA